ncbi:unnamed protein product, partial [Vitis vinifera]
MINLSLGMRCALGMQPSIISQSYPYLIHLDVSGKTSHVEPVHQISWSADGRLLLSGSNDSILKVNYIRTQKLKQDLPGYEDEVFIVDWSLDGEKVATGGRDRVLSLWMG